jgi:hypothetical protein
MAALTALTRSKAVLAFFLTMQVIAATSAVRSEAKDFVLVDFRPSTFTEQPTAPFFYSVGRKIRFGSALADSGPVLLEAKLEDEVATAVYVSPDQGKAIVASPGELYLLEPGKPAVVLLKDVPFETFYYHRTIQWDRTSRYIYVRRVKARQGQTAEAVLLRVDTVAPANVVEAVRDFRDARYFLMDDNVVCYHDAIGNGDLAWKCIRQGIPKLVKTAKDDAILLEDGSSVPGKPFMSYHGNIYESDIWLTRYGFSLRTTPTGFTGLFSRQRPDDAIFIVKGGYNIKGHYLDGVSQRNCIVLPGGRYALLDIWLGNFKGQLLVDGFSGQYRELPRGTRAYRNLNSSTDPNLVVGLRPLDFPEFRPAIELRTSVTTLPGSTR